MAKTMKLIALLSLAATIFFSAIYIYNNTPVFLSLSITFGTTAYHFCFRLIVGNMFNIIMKNRADYTKKWYCVKAWEKKLYAKLKVKKWKNKMPTYDIGAFDVSKHSWDEIAQASCQSELVHEMNVILSFVPIIFSIWFSSLAVFIITSICGAVFDSVFVIIQRYNRPRILKMVNRRSISKEKRTI